MIRHVVFFKFRRDASDDERKSGLAELRALRAKIEAIRDLEVGEDVLRGPRSWDAVLVATFDSMDALDHYQGHAAHVPIAGLMRSLCDSIGSVDYAL